MRTSLLAAVRGGLGVLAVLAVGYAVVDQWDGVADALRELSPATVLAAWLAVVAALLASLLSWRALLRDLGGALPVTGAARVFFLGQTAKYVPPGTVWAIVAQVELAQAYGVPRRRSAAAAVLANALNLAIGLALVAGTIPFLVDVAAPWLVLVPAAATLAWVLARPSVPTRLADTGLRMLRQPRLDRPFSSAGLTRALGWSSAMWLLLGLQVWLLALDLGAEPGRAALASLGGFAAAWTAGFVSVVAPAGAGIRELVLVLTLAPALPGGATAALTVAVLSRAAMTAGDVTVALAALAWRSGRRTPEPAQVARSSRRKR